MYLDRIVLTYDLGFYLCSCIGLGAFEQHLMSGIGVYQIRRVRSLLMVNFIISLVVVFAILFLGGLSALVEKSRSMSMILWVAYIAVWNVRARIGIP